MNEWIYGWCNDCGNYMYREPGKWHGDGQQDTNDNPVWLLLEPMSLTSEEQKAAALIYCGCDG